MKQLFHDLAHGFLGAVVVVGLILIVGAVLLGCSEAVAEDDKTYTREEVQKAVAQAFEYGRQVGQADASAAIEEARTTLERCAIARGI